MWRRKGIRDRDDLGCVDAKQGWRVFAVCVNFLVGNVNFDIYGNGGQEIVRIFDDGIRLLEI